MAGEQSKVSTPLLANILNQPQALRLVLECRSTAALNKAAHFLRSKKRIVLSGMGASLFACILLKASLQRQGVDVTCVETAELLHFGSTSLGSETALVLVSRSGESVEVIRLLEQVRGSGTRVLGISNVVDSRLSKMADLSLLVGSPADQLVAVQTYTSTLAVLALLGATIGGKLEEACKEFAHAIEILDRLIPSWVEQRQQWNTFLQEDSPLYLLARGAAMASAMEGMLLLHETAKAPAIAISIPQFRHGPVEVVDGKFRAIVIGTQQETAKLDYTLAQDLIRMGGQVRWLGPQTEGIPSLCEWPQNFPARFVPLAETIPLQIVAYLKAEMRGVTPGDFRWAPAVTDSEVGFPGIKP
jgi:glucosamine--fructose-6-phosphate aminotransferase (isomerizing)